MEKATILYVEDEPTLAQVVREGLGFAGYRVAHYAMAEPALRSLATQRVDIAVLDVMLPDMDGFSLCRAIRALDASLPIVFLTARVEVDDFVEGFAAGGTDYLRKPFSMQELVVRIENQLRLRSAAAHAAPTGATPIGCYRYVQEQYLLVAPSGVSHRLSLREHQLLTMLLGGAGAVVQRQEILMAIWGDDSFFNSRSLDVYVRKLRQLFEEDAAVQIVTLRGRGYLMRTE